MHHIVWVDIQNGRFYDDYYGSYTKIAIERYERKGWAQILSSAPVKEGAK